MHLKSISYGYVIATGQVSNLATT